MGIKIVIPTIEFLVQLHHNQVEEAVAAMLPPRPYAAEIKLSGWRRVLNAVNPNGNDGDALTDHNLQLGGVVKLPEGALILSVNSSWAKAKWYVGRYVVSLERWAALYLVEETGLKQLIKTSLELWAGKALGFLATKPTRYEQAGVSFGPGPWGLAVASSLMSGQSGSDDGRAKK